MTMSEPDRLTSCPMMAPDRVELLALLIDTRPFGAYRNPVHCASEPEMSIAPCCVLLELENSSGHCRSKVWVLGLPVCYGALALPALALPGWKSASSQFRPRPIGAVCSGSAPLLVVTLSQPEH